MIKIIAFFSIIMILNGQKCQQINQVVCQANGCLWVGNSTCTNQNKTCLSGLIYSSSQDKCVNCLSLDSSQCNKLCPSHFFQTTCQSCETFDPACISCSTQNVCTQCATNYKIIDQSGGFKVCVPLPCNITNCYECSSNASCYICRQNYSPSFPNGSQCVLSTCQIENCFACQTNSTCLKCLNEYVLNNNKNKCNAICEDSNCLFCGAPNTCSQCKPTFYFDSLLGVCRLDCKVLKCLECDTQQTCKKCQSGYQLNQFNTFCNLICNDANCDRCSAANKCDKCITGYILNASFGCDKAICNILGCSVCLSAGACFTCLNNYNLVDSICVGKCINSTNNCLQCSSATLCSSCIYGYTLNTNLNICQPSCSIANCILCLSNSLCRSCEDTYVLSDDKKTCNINCGVRQCYTCNSTSTCSTCNYPYIPLLGGTVCGLTCSLGFYYNTATKLCRLCSLDISNCNQCTLVISNVLCRNCIDGFYLTSINTCISCSTQISNCLSCLNFKSCTRCAFGYNLVYDSIKGYICYLPPTCQITNCLQCQTGNSKVCITCNDGYTTTNAGLCSLIVCNQGSQYNPNTKKCECYRGYYLKNNKCHQCNIKNCVVCDSVGCIACVSGFFESGGKCKACINNCQTCLSSNTCEKCLSGYKYTNGKCKKLKVGVANADNGDVVACPGGCSSCTVIDGQVVACQPADGYSLDTDGNLIKCVQPCASCFRNDASLCTSCFGATILMGATCKGCADKYATTCSADSIYSITCIQGYSPSNGHCLSCAANCLSCGVNGANKCDTCKAGYVILEGSTSMNCTKCFKGCSSCSSNDPSKCLSCNKGQYLNTTISICLSCPSVCVSCTSNSVCDDCKSNYILSNGFCYLQKPFPCSDQIGDICTQCYSGYKLQNNQCAFADCNTTNNCLNCPQGQYLKGKRCFNCLTDSTSCLFCEVSKPNRCKTCKDGYYITSSKTCQACSIIQGCSQCIADDFCSVAKDGYYLVLGNIDQNTGLVEKCDVSCKTCIDGSSCIQCASLYNKVGGKCVYQNNLQVVIVIGGYGSNTWLKNGQDQIQNNTVVANSFLNINQFLYAFSLYVGINQKYITFLNLKKSSVQVQWLAEAVDVSLTQMQKNINNNQQILKQSGFESLKVSTTTNTIPTSVVNQNDVNYGLIIGITVPIVALITFVIILKNAISSSDKQISEKTQTNKQIQNEEEMYY